MNTEENQRMRDLLQSGVFLIDEILIDRRALWERCEAWTRDVARLGGTFGIDDMHGRRITTGLRAHEARRVAQRIADDRDEAVLLHEIGSPQPGEVIKPGAVGHQDDEHTDEHTDDERTDEHQDDGSRTEAASVLTRAIRGWPQPSKSTSVSW